MKIYNTEIGSGRTFVIAELCSNIIPHLDNLEGCVDVVAGTGATAVKIQLFHNSHFPKSEQAEKRKWEFPRERFPELVSLCHSRGLACGASVFDEDAVDLVAEHGDFIKLATREVYNSELYNYCVGKLPLIFSYDYRKWPHGLEDWDENTFPLACIPEYPVIHLGRIGDLNVGWSSHTDHWLDCVVAVSRGAVAVEKHLAFTSQDPEINWSLMPNQFSQMVQDIRWAEGVR